MRGFESYCGEGRERKGWDGIGIGIRKGREKWGGVRMPGSGCSHACMRACMYVCIESMSCRYVLHPIPIQHRTVFDNVPICVSSSPFFPFIQDQ